MSHLVEIDGSYGEGGGQILRTSLSLAILAGRPVEITNVRGRRKKPGLQPQHLTAVRAAARICCAGLTGDMVGSTALRFEPGAPAQPGHYHFDVGTAGAAPLVLQTVLLPLALAPGRSTVAVTGGTHVPHAPPADYLERVYLPALRRAGVELHFEWPAAGYFPRGGGHLRLEIPGAAVLRPVDLVERGRLVSLRAHILSSGLPDHVLDRGTAVVERYMRGIGRPVTVDRLGKPSPGPGAAVLIAAECENGLAGFASIGERGKPMEKVAEAPCEEFLKWWKSGAAVDEHLADQLVLPAALAGGESRWTTPAVTEHVRTVLWVVRQFLPVEVALEQPGEGPIIVALCSSG